ncbi:hypothetical protein LA080_011814 [Diaporthe eres]|nr:hypothetical protein LA080_011814 [Diaporthe eres]
MAPPPPILRFSDHVDIHTFEADFPRRRRRGKSTKTMAKVITTYEGEKVTAAMLEDAAKLFSDNYGIWGHKGPGKPGRSFPPNLVYLRGHGAPTLWLPLRESSQETPSPVAGNTRADRSVGLPSW